MTDGASPGAVMSALRSYFRLTQDQAGAWAAAILKLPYSEASIRKGILRAGTQLEYPSLKGVVECIRVAAREKQLSRPRPPPPAPTLDGERLVKVRIAARVIYAATLLGELRDEEGCNERFTRLIERETQPLLELLSTYQVRLREAGLASSFRDFESIFLKEKQ